MFILGLTFGKFHFWLNCCDSKKKCSCHHAVGTNESGGIKSVHTSVCQRDHLIDEV